MTATAPSKTGPAWRSIGGYPVWSDAAGEVEVRFVGRGEERSREATLAAVEASVPPVAALRQVHSARVVEAAASGFAGEGDALITARPGLALSVITADCVPVLLTSGDRIAAVHAGWRGLVAGVVPAALDRLRRDSGGAARAGHEGSAEGAAPSTAWVGPTIGACCYEVGDDVAMSVVAASAPEVAALGPGGRPHLDLARAVELQLRRAGVADVRRLGPCTRCSPDLLWSYRREGKRAGRNIAYVWRRG
jgi:YfiH family protein